MSETGGPESAPPSRPSSHRAQPDPSPFLGRLIAPVVAVGVVVVVIVLLLLINGHGSGKKSVALQSPSTPTSPTAVTSAPAPSTPATPTAHRTATHSAHPKSSKPAPAPHPRHTKPATSTLMAPVQVLNNSRRTGLAHQAAAELQNRGWPITAVGNLQGRLAETTVYFAPGDHGAAMHLAAEFGSIQRVAPNAEGGIRASGLTLVLTRYWSG